MISKLSEKIFFKALDKAKFGSVKLEILDPPKSYIFGDGELMAELKVKSMSLLMQIVNGGDIELANAVIRDDISISSEAAFIEWICRNQESLSDTFYGNFISTFIPKMQRLFRRNTVEGAKRNIMQHYDLGNSFYDKWLDPSMTYSSALFANGDFIEDLQAAQFQKYDRIIAQLEISKKDHLLEIGCGWGGFFSRAVQLTGCKVTAVMNSPAQFAYNQELVKKNGLKDYIDLHLIDYRMIDGKFDKIVSIEMIEAVGQKYWPTYFSKVSDSLKSKGKALIQAITIDEKAFQRYSENPDFINTMIFPGGMLLTNKAILRNSLDHQMREALPPFEFGMSYAETLKRWRANFLDAWDKKRLPELDRKFINLWRFYLAYCEGAFKAERINVGHYLLGK